MARDSTPVRPTVSPASGYLRNEALRGLAAHKLFCRGKGPQRTPTPPSTIPVMGVGDFDLPGLLEMIERRWRKWGKWIGGGLLVLAVLAVAATFIRVTLYGGPSPAGAAPETPASPPAAAAPAPQERGDVSVGHDIHGNVCTSGATCIFQPPKENAPAKPPPTSKKTPAQQPPAPSTGNCSNNTVNGDHNIQSNDCSTTYLGAQHLPWHFYLRGNDVGLVVGNSTMPDAHTVRFEHISVTGDFPWNGEVGLMNDSEEAIVSCDHATEHRMETTSGGVFRDDEGPVTCRVLRKAP